MKPIEEYAKAYATDKMCKALGLTPDCINRTDALIPKFCGKDIEEAVEDGANHVMSLPLSERLTTGEKCAIIFAYTASKGLSEATNNPNVTEVFKGQYLLLESIFGKSMFAEEGGER